MLSSWHLLPGCRLADGSQAARPCHSRLFPGPESKMKGIRLPGVSQLSPAGASSRCMRWPGVGLPGQGHEREKELGFARGRDVGVLLTNSLITPGQERGLSCRAGPEPGASLAAPPHEPCSPLAPSCAPSPVPKAWRLESKKLSWKLAVRG